MNGVSSVGIFSWGLESPPQLINLNKRGYERMERLVFSNPTHHS